MSQTRTSAGDYTIAPLDIGLLPEPRPGIPSPREIDENFYTRALDNLEAWLRVNQPSAEFRCILRHAVKVLAEGGAELK